MAQKHEPVVFEDSQGNIITNDPIYKAQQLLRDAGVDQPESTDNSLMGEPEDDSDDDDESAEDDDETAGDELEAMNGKELKALAKQRGIDISGLTKVSEVRDAIRAASTEE